MLAFFRPNTPQLPRQHPFGGYEGPRARDFMGSGSVLQQVLGRAGGTGDFCLASYQNPLGAWSHTFLSPGPWVPEATDLWWLPRNTGKWKLRANTNHQPASETTRLDWTWSTSFRASAWEAEAKTEADAGQSLWVWGQFTQWVQDHPGLHNKSLSKTKTKQTKQKKGWTNPTTPWLIRLGKPSCSFTPGGFRGTGGIMLWSRETIMVFRCVGTQQFSDILGSMLHVGLHWWKKRPWEGFVWGQCTDLYTRQAWVQIPVWN